MKLKGKIAIITGASSGIGYSIAEAFAGEGSDLILIARREEKIVALGNNLKEKYSINVLTKSLDIRNYQDIKEFCESLTGNWQNIDILVNNAGKACGLNKIDEGIVEDWDEMLDTNIKGLLYITRLIIPGMKKRGKGHIINIGSIAGIEVYPGGNVYCASKFAVRALSTSMAIDLNGTGIRVTNIQPGLVETEFSLVRFHGDTERAKQTYKGYKPLNPEDISDVALFAVTRPAHVMIQEITVTPTDQASPYVLNKK